MQVSPKSWKRLGFGVVLGVAAWAGVRFWVIPAVIVGKIQSQVGGKVTIRDWWLDGRSAGVIGLVVHEGWGGDSPAWVEVDRVTTDLTLGGLLRGRSAPSRVMLQRPKLAFRLDREGRFLNVPAARKGGDAGPTARIPRLSVEDARVSFRREGMTEEMLVSRIVARLEPDPKGRRLGLSAEADDPSWGRWVSSGTIDLDEGRGDVRLSADRVEADPQRLARVPFIPAEVWLHVAPHGPVDVNVALGWGPGTGPAFRMRAEVALLGNDGRFPSLGINAAGTTGRMWVEGGIVHLEGVRGRALGGEVAARGVLDFARPVPRVDLDLDLKGIDVAETPKTWQLDEAGITGLLTGKGHLLAKLDPAGVDLSGTSGEAVVEKGSIQGIPVKSLRLVMHAEGSDLRYDTRSRESTSGRGDPRAIEMASGRVPARLGMRRVSGEDPPLAPPWKGGEKKRGREKKREGRRSSETSSIARVVVGLIALGTTGLEEEPASKKAEPQKKGGVLLPKSISTQLELEDVDVAQLVAKVQYLSGLPAFPVPISGRLSLKAEARIPLGALRDIKGYEFHGDVTLTGASIARVDFGRLTARLDLADGVFELKDLRGVLVDRPNGGPDNPPPTVPPTVSQRGPLPTGGFRGNLRAEISPPGPLSARFEGNQLPLGELAAPALPRPTPLGGLASLDVEARVDLGAIGDAKAWTVSGRAESVRITYRGEPLDRVALEFGVKEGHLDIPKLEAKLDGRPLTARGGLDLAPPRAFSGTLDVTGWDLASVESLIPGAPRPSPVAGLLSAHAEGSGTFAPWAVRVQGQGRVDRFQAGPVPLGDVPFRWTTDRDTVVISGVEARPFGGRFSAEARVPIVADKPVEGSATLSGIDLAKLADAMPDRALKLTGRADGSLAFAIPAQSREVNASVNLSSPDLTVQGIPAERVQAAVRAHQGILKYEVTAQSLGGKIKLLGNFPLAAHSPGTQRAVDAELRVVGFTLEALWRVFSLSGPVTDLGGLGALDANLRQVLEGTGKGLWARGIVELRDLSLGKHHPLGRLRGEVVGSPGGWRIEPLSGEVAGGTASGRLWGTTPPAGPRRLGFNVRIDRAPLKQVLVSLPRLSANVEGSATLRLRGDLAEALRVEGDLQLADARLAGLPVGEFHAPAELIVTPASGNGALHLRRLSARLAGGVVRGDGTFRIGQDRAFESQAQLAGVDLQAFTRLMSDSKNASSGRLSGRVSLAGPDLAAVERYRGKILLDLDEASLFNLPVFREIDRFLGSARGGLFEDGDLVATIANRQVFVEMLTLEGRIVQLHASGTVGFDTTLNLEVLINTNQIIPQTGQALVRLIPGLREALGRSEEAILRVSNFLSNRLLKLRVTGTLKNPSVAVDASIAVASTAVGFFSGVLKLPLGFVK